MKQPLYYIVGGEGVYSEAEVIQLAQSHGFELLEPKEYEHYGMTPIECAMVYLTGSPGIEVKQCKDKKKSSGDVLNDVNSKSNDIKKPIVMVYNNTLVVGDEVKVSKDECWSIQLFGVSGCISCDHRLKETCNGKECLRLGHNNMGFKIPVAEKGIEIKRRTV